VLAGFVLARASAGLVDSTIRNDTNHLELIRDWFGRPLWEMQPADADAYFGKVLRDARPSIRTGRAAALTVYFEFLAGLPTTFLHTGGGCTALEVRCEAGRHLLITDAQDSLAWSRDAQQGWAVGAYRDDTAEERKRQAETYTELDLALLGEDRRRT